MDESRKTIKMPKKLLADWLAALRSGMFRQGHQMMVTPDGGHCCLAVLVAVAGDDPRASKHDNCLPDPMWLKAHDIQFVDAEGREFNQHARTPYLPMLECSASTANDQKGHSFLTIARAIEDCAIGV